MRDRLEKRQSLRVSLLNVRQDLRSACFRLHFDSSYFPSLCALLGDYFVFFSILIILGAVDDKG